MSSHVGLIFFLIWVQKEPIASIVSTGYRSIPARYWVQIPSPTLNRTKCQLNCLMLTVNSAHLQHHQIYESHVQMKCDYTSPTHYTDWGWWLNLCTYISHWHIYNKVTSNWKSTHFCSRGHTHPHTQYSIHNNNIAAISSLFLINN